MLLVLSRRTAYEGGRMLLSTVTTLPAALLPSLSKYHSLQQSIHIQTVSRGLLGEENIIVQAPYVPSAAKQARV